MKISSEVLTVLESATSDGGGIALNGQLERKTYVAVNKVLEGAGFVWNRKARRHAHPRACATEALESMLATGEVVTLGELGFFETTGVALSILMGAADVRFGMGVLEPSAGSGNIVRCCIIQGAIPVDVCEVQDDLRAHLGAEPFVRTIGSDFLTVPHAPVYDRVVMNPPFATPGRPRADLDHVEHALGFVKPGGKLATIMSAGVSFRTDRRTAAFREKIAGYGAFAWRPLPEGSFTASGTSVNTVLLKAERPHV